MSEPVGIGQGRKSRGEMLRQQIEDMARRIADAGLRVEIKKNRYDRLVALAYRGDKLVLETGITDEREANRKILAMVEINPTPDKQIAYEEAFIEQARAFRKEATDVS